MRLAAGLLLALCSAGCFTAAAFGQHRAVALLGPLRLRHPLGGARALAGSPGWLLAYAANWVGWALYVAALVFAPLSLVQATSTGSIGGMALLAHHYLRPLRRAERYAAVLSSAGLLLVLASLRPLRHEQVPSLGPVVLLLACLLGAAAVALVAPVRNRGARLGIAAGLCTGAADLATKRAIEGAAVLVPVLLVCAALGFVALQMAYQRTSLLGSAGLSSLVLNAVPLIAGVTLFHETAPPGPSGWIRYAGFALVVVGAGALTGGEPREPGEPGRPNRREGVGPRQRSASSATPSARPARSGSRRHGA